MTSNEWRRVALNIHRLLGAYGRTQNELESYLRAKGDKPLAPLLIGEDPGPEYVRLVASFFGCDYEDLLARNPVDSVNTHTFERLAESVSGSPADKILEDVRARLPSGRVIGATELVGLLQASLFDASPISEGQTTRLADECPRCGGQLTYDGVCEREDCNWHPGAS